MFECIAHGNGLALRRRDRVDHFLRFCGVAAVVDDDGITILTELFGNGCADAAGCAGDDGDLPGSGLLHGELLG